MKQILLFLSLFIGLITSAQDNYEIQVYGAETQAKNSTIFELHSNYTFQGEKSMLQGVRPSFHTLHETIEITHGVSEDFEIGFYLFTNYSAQYGYKIIGSHIRPRIKAPKRWNLPVGLSLSAEVGFQSLDYSPDSWNMEIRPIIDKQWNKLYLSFNPTLGVSLKGVDNDSRPVFEPNFKMSYSFFKKANLGLEYYGSLGTLSHFSPPAEQSHALYAIFDMMGNDKWELNAGPGWGLTKATDGFVFKVLVGRRIQWHR
ncbi:MAG: hypothetical protein NTY72_14095 [Bacteroidetes bacterium]|nr:hypothetical protein [Bacteroidota bacterium]